ncbi:MAG: hypothetical protein ACLFPJ_06355 [Candidatus Woesearchaeota archaeon]
MNLFAFLYVLVGILIGIITSYTDIMFGKIRNKIILFGIFLFFLISIINYFAVDLFFGDYNFFIYILVNFLLSLLIGFLLFFFGFWTAGDAKLYIVFSLLLSGIFLNLTSYYNEPILVLLIFTFVPFFIYLFIYLLLKLDFFKATKDIVKAFSLKNIFSTALFFFVISYIFSFISINKTFGFLLMIIFIYLVTQIIDVKHFSKITSILLLISVIRLIFDKTVFNPLFLIQMFFFVLFFCFFRYFLLEYSFNIFSFNKKINHLKKGDLPAQMIIKTKKGFVKKNISYMGFSLFMKENNFLFNINPAGFSNKDIKKIKHLYNEKKFNFDKIRIYNVLPFAPFLFLGFLLINFMIFFGYLV